MASPTALPLALLIIYITLSLPTIYIAIKHGVRHGVILGWFFLFAFCTLRIVSSAIELNDAHNSSAPLIASIGLSPLLASVCGILHEARVHILPKSHRRFDIPYLVIFHLVVTTAIALVTAGASNMNNSTLPLDQVNSSSTLVKAGMIMLLLSWLSLAVFTLATAQHLFTPRSRKMRESGGGKKLLLAVTISMPFLGIRILERLIYFFTQNQELNPVIGSFGLRIGLEVVEELIVSLSLITSGIMTRNIAKSVESM